MAPAIFFCAHQDDETLIMGPSVIQHARVRRTIVVLCTDGSNSGVKSVYPSEAEFVKERDREFVAAVTTMGAEPVIHPNRAEDGTLTEARATQIMSEYATRYPSASLKTLSPTDFHTDHATLGRALTNLDFPDKRFYIRWEHFDSVEGYYTQFEEMKDALLDYAPVGWLSARKYFEHSWPQARSKYHK